MKSKQKKLVICGGCGFMGSHFVRHLYNKYPLYKIINLDLLTYAGNRENLKDITKKEKSLPLKHRRYKFIKADINDKNRLEALFEKEKPDVVVNFAAESHVDRSILSAAEFIRTNIQGAYVLLDAVRKSKVPRYVYISTDEVYGDISPGIKSDENYPFRPTNPYAASKAGADLLVQSYIKTHNVPALILRSSNNYGTHQYPEKLHPLVITNLIQKKKIPVHGSGKHVRSWIHVDDFCDALDVIIHKAKNGKIYNISGEEKTNLDVIREIARILEINISKYLDFVTDRSAPDFRYSPDRTKIEKELGWKPKTSYNTALKEIVRWYTENGNWWKKIKNKGEFRNLYLAQTRGRFY